MRAQRVGRITALAGLLGAGGVIGVTGAAPAPAAGTDPAPVCVDDQCTVTFGLASQPQYFTVPNGASGFQVQLTGGNGWGARANSSTDNSQNYGLGAVVSSAGVFANPGQRFQITVGGGALSNVGGYNGGGNGFKSIGGGGGATDLRAATSTGQYPISSRILVAAGGGGAGANSVRGGKAGQAGSDGDGKGGGYGQQDGAGLGGLGAHGDSDGHDGGTGMGTGGAQGTGGDAGGSASTNSTAGAGGGGYWGGGGGGGGGVASPGNPSGGSGGGGGGSNYIGTVAQGIQGLTAQTGYNLKGSSAADAGADGALVIVYGDPAPRLGSLSPSSGSTAGGTTVTLKGSGFTGATKVAFGGVAATTITVVDDSTITAVTPTEAAGTVSVSVTGPTGTNEDKPGDSYTFVTPVASSVTVGASPASVVADGTSSSVLTATVQDQFGGPFAGPGVTLTASDPAVKIGAVTDSGGSHTALYTSSTVAGSVTVTAKTTGGTALTGTTTVTQTAKPAPAPAPTTTPTPTPAPAPTKAPLAPVITLLTSGTFVPIGTDVAYTGKVTVAGGAVAGVTVALTETYVDGKTVNLGQTTTLTDGSYRLTSHPLYIGTITATAMGVSASAPSRVIVTYRSMTAKQVGGTVRVHAETRPGFIATPSRQERAQILLVDARGKQLKVLAIVNAAQRKLFPGEAQGTNAIDATVTLPPGRYHVEVKVLGTPVNTGAPSKPIAVTVS